MTATANDTAQLEAELEFATKEYEQAQDYFEAAVAAFIDARDRVKGTRIAYTEAWQLALKSGVGVPVRLPMVVYPRAFRDA